jgi:putative acyl-CoA dehydrogenase
MPRFRPDGAVNALHFQRLKDKLGNRSNVVGSRMWTPSLGVSATMAGACTIIQMVQLTRLDCAIASAG